ALANEAGGNDNITVIVVDVLADDVDGLAVPPTTVHDGSGSPTKTASMPAITVAAPPRDDAIDEPVEETASEEDPRRHAARRRRLVAAGLIVVLVIGAFGAFVGVRSFLNAQWYVGARGDRVAVYQGIPASLLGLRLSRVT